jgi:diguanylate cyclase (GGDEF)-like protein/PAS domain S-box-containing protein
MTDRAELLEAALESRPDGIALLGIDSEVTFWNRAAEAITGYSSIDLLARPIPAPLEPLLLDAALQLNPPPGSGPPPNRGAVVHVHHKLGHAVQAIARRVILRDALGERIGTAVAFHPAECLDALPHGETGESATEEGLESSRADLEERLQMEFDDFARGGPPFGVLWISVDQAAELRKTHGVAPCNAMLDKVRHAVAQGLRPAEEMGRWGDDEFLIVTHERTAEMLASHAQTLVGLARTADFRWWGDRISITVSIGAAQGATGSDESLSQLLRRACQAMQAGSLAGGNRAALAAKLEAACSPS